MKHSFLFIFFFFLLSLPCFHASRITPAAAPTVTSTTNTPDLEQGRTQKYSSLHDYDDDDHDHDHDYDYGQGHGHGTWNQRTYTYALSPSHTIHSQSQADIRDVIQHSFAQWAAVIPLIFVETRYYGNADIKIAFYSGDHGDGYPLDGSLGTSGRGGGCLPNCEIHLDADENWSIDDFWSGMSGNAMDMETLVTHQIGHVLGLGHSSNPLAVMYATLPVSTTRHLTLDDISRAQALYGVSPSFVFGSSPWTNSKPMPTGRFGFFHGWRTWVLLSIFCVVF